MKKQKVVAMLGVGIMALSLTGCGDQAQVSELRELPALNAEADVQNNYSLSYTDKQNLVYAQVSARTLLDLGSLEACDENSVEQVKNYLDSVDDILVGNTKNDGTYIDSCFTDYLLANFETTPYYWQRTKTTIRGMDAESRAIVADVTYKTISFNKDCKDIDSIPLGCTGYDVMIKTRYERLISILNKKFSNSDANWQQEMNEWEQTYGKYEDLYKNQVNDSLTDTLFETGNQITYPGLQDSEQEKSGGTMTVRYILVPDYTLGINLGINCEHMYILNYKLDSDPTEGLDLFTDEGYDTVTDAVYNLMYSYFTCRDESDYDGLCKLSSNSWSGLDRYYYDMFETSYQKHDNFSLSIFSIEGTHITAGVAVGSKERAKGSNMLSMPSYNDRYYVECDLVDGELVVDNLVLLSREITGEPAIRTEEADTSGYISSIDLTNEDKQSIENLICNFSSVQLNGDDISDDFGKTVDMTMTESDLNTLKTSMTSLSGVKKVVFLINYQQGTSNYASVKCKENFQNKDNSIVEANVTYDFIKKGGAWYVYKYTVNSSTKLDTTNLATNGSLCLVSPGKIESYTSQIQATASSDEKTNTADTVEEFEHKEYTPKLKNGSQEQGVEKGVKASDITDEQLNDFLTSGIGMSLDEFNSMLSLLGDSDYATKITNLYKRCAALLINQDNGVYSASEAKTEYNAIVDEYNSLTDEYYDNGGSEELPKLSKIS